MSTATDHLRDEFSADCDPDLADAIDATPGAVFADSVEAAREVVRTRGARKVHGFLLDLFTATAVVAVADAFERNVAKGGEAGERSAKNLARFRAMPADRAATVAWKLVR